MASHESHPVTSNGAEPAPMFQLSDHDVGNVGLSGVDLDDLFVDCYFDSHAPGLGADSTTVTANSMETPTPESIPSASTNHAVGPSPPPPAAAAAVAGATTSATTQAILHKPVITSSATKTTPTLSGAHLSSAAGGDRKRSAEESGLDNNNSGDDMDNEGTKDLTDKQKLERRERNREHAKRSRLRKKFLLESLQEQIHGLQEQMEALKDALKKEAPEKAEGIINQICGSKEKYTPLPMPSGFGPVKTLMEPDFRLMTALSGSQQNFAISDPTLPDNPIVYVSQGFLDLTGYTLDQVLGRNCRFLQGPGTDQSAVDVIRGGIAEGVDTSVCLLNYKADGTPFWNQVFVAALRDAENNVVNFVGVQCEVSKAVVEKHMGDKKKRS